MMNQLLEKQTPTSIKHAVWSDIAELLAICNELGQVEIYNINWELIRLVEAPQENTKVLTICWKPDGLVLAIAYDHNEVHIVEVKQGERLKKIRVCASYCHWLKESFTFRFKEYQDNNDDYAPKPVFLPPTDNEVAVDEFRKLTGQKSMNFLILGLSNGTLQFYVNGLYRCFSLNVLKLAKEEKAECEIVYADVSNELNTVCIVMNVNNKLKCLLVDSNQLAKRAQCLYEITYRRGIFDVNLDLLDRTMSYVVGAWEKVLATEKELQLNKCSSTDYLDLLLRGRCSTSLQSFLTNELPASRLNELSSSIQSLHAIIHKLFLYPMQLTTENIIHDLTLLQGMHKTCLNNNKPFINIEETVIEECLVAAGGYCIKSNEMLNTINTSSAKYKCFFKWLSIMITDLTEGKKNAEEFTSQEKNLITQFICEMDESSKISDMKSIVSLNLLDADSSNVKNNGNCSWLNLLKENPTLENCLLVMPSAFQSISLIRLHKYLRSCAAFMYENFEKFIYDFHTLNLWCFTDSASKVSVVKHCHDNRLLVAFTKVTENGMYANIIKVINAHSQPESLSLYFNTEEYNQLYVRDLQFYNNEVLSVLLHGKNLTFYFHLSVKELAKRSYGKESIKNGFSLVSKVDRLRVIENMNCSSLVVNGTIRCGLFLTENRRHFRIYRIECSNENNENCKNYECDIIAPDSSYEVPAIGSFAGSSIARDREFNTNYFSSTSTFMEEEVIVNLNTVEMNNLRIS